MIQAVLFDFDGTLVDSESLHHESWLEAAAPWGVSVGWEEYESQLVGITDQFASKYFLEKAGIEPTADQIEEGCRLKHLAYRKRSVQELSIYPDVLEWLRSNYQRTPLGVVSSSEIPDVVPILQQQEVTDFLRFVICSNHVTRLKPDPMPYQLALEKLRASCGALCAHSCLVFEDSQTGVKAAQEAGMTVHRLASPDELPNALKSWNERIQFQATDT